MQLKCSCLCIADGENGQPDTPPELGAVDAVLNLSKDKWLKPSPAQKVRRIHLSILSKPPTRPAIPETLEVRTGHQRLCDRLVGVGSGENNVRADGLNRAGVCAQRDRKPAIREGPQYQARVPDGPPRPRPTGSEGDDPRAGMRGPTPEEMLAIAAGPEKEAANALPPDARTDDDNVANVNGALLCAA